MRWFGKDWGAPVNESCEQAPRPVGELCLDCREPIEEGDDGFLIPFMSMDGGQGEKPHHYRCFVEQVIGVRLPGVT